MFRNRAGGLEDTGLQATLTHRAAKILPTVAMLHDVEQQMLMLGLEGDAGYNGRDPYRTHNMYKLDLQKEVVSEYKFKRVGVIEVCERNPALKFELPHPSVTANPRSLRLALLLPSYPLLTSPETTPNT